MKMATIIIYFSLKDKKDEDLHENAYPDYALGRSILAEPSSVSGSQRSNGPCG
jgi:hypothetical protein